jgi:C4-dicarboxylate transporter DctM subunit
MLVLNIEIASVTPPVGVNLFVISGIGKLSIENVARGALPFVLVLLVALGIISYIPSISLVFE